MLVDTTHFDSIELGTILHNTPRFGCREKIANSDKNQTSTLFSVSRKENKKPTQQNFNRAFRLLGSFIFLPFPHTYPATKQNDKTKSIRKSEKWKREMYLLLLSNLLPKLAGLFSQSIHCFSGVLTLLPKPEEMRLESNNKDWNDYFRVSESLDLTACLRSPTRYAKIALRWSGVHQP